MNINEISYNVAKLTYPNSAYKENNVLIIQKGF